MTNRLAIIQYYARAIRRLDARIRSLMLYYARTEDRILAEALAALAAQVSPTLRERRRRAAVARDILRAVDSTARVQVPVLINQSFQIGQQIADLGTEDRARGLSKVNREAMKLLTENLIEDLGAATQTVGRRVEDLFRKEALRVALRDVPAETPREMQVIDLRESLKRQGVTAFIDRSGRQWGLQNYAEMATITVTQEGINVANLNLLTERGIDLVEINSVKNPCVKICLKYNGETFSLTGRASGYPVLEERPPFHPRCRHFVFASPQALRERRESGWTPSLEPEREKAAA